MSDTKELVERLRKRAYSTLRVFTDPLDDARLLREAANALEATRTEPGEVAAFGEIATLRQALVRACGRFAIIECATLDMYRDDPGKLTEWMKATAARGFRELNRALAAPPPPVTQSRNDVLEVLREVRAAFQVEYHEDGRVASVSYGSETLRPIIAKMDDILKSVTPQTNGGSNGL